MNKDLSVMINDVKLNIRVGCIIKYQNKILVEKNKNVDFAVIPGGRVQTLENSNNTLIRELKEELGIDFSNEQFNLISIIENFFKFDNTKYHELYLVYQTELKNDYNLQDGFTNLDNQDSKYYFLSEEAFKQEKLLPDILKDLTKEKEFKHYIVDEL